MAKKFPDVKVLRIAKADREALDRVSSVLSGGNASRTLRRLIHDADAALKKAGVYAKHEALINSPLAKATERKLTTLLDGLEAKRKARDEAGSDKATDWDLKWGNKGPAAKSAGGPVEASASTYADRYGNE